MVNHQWSINIGVTYTSKSKCAASLLFQSCKYNNLRALLPIPFSPPWEGTGEAESFGQLVVLGFDVTVFTPAPYQRPRLGRPS